MTQFYPSPIGEVAIPTSTLPSIITESMDNAKVADEGMALLMAERGQKPPQLYTDESSVTSEEKRSLLRHMSQSWTDYNTILEKHPVLVKSLTGLIILSMGDLSAQGLEHWRGTAAYIGVDWPRVSRFGVFGLMGAPWSHYYFHYLDTYIPPTPEPFTQTTAVKVFIDQFIQAPILLALMISLLSIMKGTGVDGVKTDMGDNYGASLIANWKLWLPASLANIAFVKPTLRVLFVNVVFFFWTIILSMMLNNSD